MTGHAFISGDFAPSTRTVATSYGDILARRFMALYPLEAHEAAAVASLVRQTFKAASHSVLLENGKSAAEAFVLLEGLACHYSVLDTTRRQITGFVVPGDLCDFSFLSSSPVRQSVMALGPVVVGRIDLARLSAVGNELPNVVLAAMRAASIDGASTRELVVSLGARNALQRMAHFFCELYFRLNVVGLVTSSGEFDLTLTQAELGEALGLSTVHVNRTLQQLRKEGLIAMGKGHLTILNLPRLTENALFDPCYLRSDWRGAGSGQEREQRSAQALGHFGSDE